MYFKKYVTLFKNKIYHIKYIKNEGGVMKYLSKLACILIVGLSGQAVARDLTVVAFGGATQEAFNHAYFQPFVTQSKKRIVQDSYTGGIARQKAMVESGNITWDVVQMDENEMALACEQGLLEVIDFKQLSNAKEITPAALSKCGVGAFVWSEVLTYDSKKFGVDGPKTWAQFWDIKKWPGKRGLRKQARMTLEIALMADGVKPADVYTLLATKAGQDRAFAKMDQIKSSIQWWESGAQPLEWLASGTVVATAAYSGRIAIANREGSHFPIAWDNQLYSMDYWTLIKNTPNKASALDLLNTMLSAERQKTFTDLIPYGILNMRTAAMIKPDVLAQLPTAPQNMKTALLLDSHFWVDHEEEIMARFNQWIAQ
ncbi:putative spermidine/putrescine transport system substrate-binding protein [Collimonas sp. PA-H2]|uniref:ABC transporter substrate-binding protein n=1 Tax=Collimonas sp. PA-H2 TaxID=1881062 RepID=UPI000C01BE6A|nr:ABC transporter substrate-binding protein [Collimonas sp. PA-H2]PFH11633.1 putative spermidine/putrescine transport system substrate-binding protein [Collimonas sp. PA-H2]